MPPPRPVLPVSRDEWLHDSAATRSIERLAAATLPPHELMQRAGAAGARLAMAVAPHAQTIDVCCGPGNNGGDGLVAALHLHQAGRRVRVLLLGDPARLPVDAADAWQRASAAGLRIETALPARLAADLLIDALLGLGASRALDGAIAQVVVSIQAAQRPVLALDLPTGLNGDTGALLGTLAVRATHTLSLLSLKPGLFTGHGRDLAGRIWFDDLGAAAAADTACASLVGPTLARRALARRQHSQHKGSFGNVAVIGGAPGMVGAALLAARAALVAGGGRVYLATVQPPHDAVDPCRPELMWRTLPSLIEPRMLGGCTVVCGCGAGETARDWLPPVLHHAARLVIDADALNAIAREPSLRQAARARAARGQPTVLTPHPLEAARLLGQDVDAVQADRLRAARALADDLQACVVLKGSGSVIAAVGERPCINTSGDARLASAGTGDVLAGWLGGLWAQHDDRAQTAFDVAAGAVWLHGRAVDFADGHGALPAADLITAIARAADPLRAG